MAATALRVLERQGDGKTGAWGQPPAPVFFDVTEEAGAAGALMSSPVRMSTLI